MRTIRRVIEREMNRTRTHTTRTLTLPSNCFEGGCRISVYQSNSRGSCRTCRTEDRLFPTLLNISNVWKDSYGLVINEITISQPVVQALLVLLAVRKKALHGTSEEIRHLPPITQKGYVNVCALQADWLRLYCLQFNTITPPKFHGTWRMFN